MRMRSALFAAALAVGGATGAHATEIEVFNGAWGGKGTLILHGDITQCSSIEFYFTVTADTFVFNGGQRTCDKHEDKFKPEQMTYRDGVFYFGDHAVGTFRNGVIEMRFRMPDGNTFRNWRMSMRREGDNLVYEDSRTMEGETKPMISFAGMLKVAGPAQTVTKTP